MPPPQITVKKLVADGALGHKPASVALQPPLVGVAFTVQVLLALSLALRHRLPRWARAPNAGAVVARLLLVEWLISLSLTVTFVAVVGSSPQLLAASCAAAAPSWGEAGLAYMRTFHLTRTLRTVLLQARARAPPQLTCPCSHGTAPPPAQVPPKLAFGYELARAAVAAAAVLYAFLHDGALDARAAARTAATAVGGLLATSALLVFHADERVLPEHFLPAHVDLCPSRLAPARDALLSALRRLRQRSSLVRACGHPAAGASVVACAGCLKARGAGAAAQVPLHRSALVGVLGLAVCEHAAADSHADTVALGRATLRYFAVVTLLSNVALGMSGGGTARLAEMARRLGVDDGSQMALEVRRAMDDAWDDEGALRDAAAVLQRRLFGSAAVVIMRVTRDAEDEDAPRTPLIVSFGDATLSWANDAMRRPSVDGRAQDETSAVAFAQAQACRARRLRRAPARGAAAHSRAARRGAAAGRGRGGGLA